jgi:transcription antitermination protein NusB
MGARTKARKRAVDVLFEADQRGRAAAAVLEDTTQRGAARNPYTGQLVDGVAAHATMIDKLLTETSVDWSVDRMPAVDRAILRMATYELLWSTEVPAEVTIDEAVELAKALSTDNSPAFVNGILSRLLERKPSLDLTAPADW